MSRSHAADNLNQRAQNVHNFASVLLTPSCILRRLWVRGWCVGHEGKRITNAASHTLAHVCLAPSSGEALPWFGNVEPRVCLPARKRLYRRLFLPFLLHRAIGLPVHRSADQRRSIDSPRFARMLCDIHVFVVARFHSRRWKKCILNRVADSVQFACKLMLAGMK